MTVPEPSSPAAPARPDPKVFLSYSWTSNEYGARVVDLANRLQDAAVEVVVDQAHLTGGQDANAFMERTVNDPSITHVLLLCDARYADRADGREGGVGKETYIVSEAVYRSATQQKFVPVITERREDGTFPLPAYLGSRFAYDLSQPETEVEQFELLVKHLYGKAAVTLRPLGQRPSYVDDDGPGLLTGRTAVTAIAAFGAHKPQRAAVLEAYGERLVEAFAAERVPSGLNDVDQIRKVHEASIAHFTPYRDEFAGVVQAVARYGGDDEVYDRLHGLFEGLLAVASDAAADRYNADYGTANLWFLLRELLMYAVALLLKAGRFDAVRRLAGRYHVTDGRGGAGVMRSVAVFDRASEVFERNVAGSALGRMLRERATLADVSVTQLREVEFVCGVRSRLDAADAEPDWVGPDLWWPRIRERWGFSLEGLPLLTRLQDGEYRRRFLAVFGLRSDGELRERLNGLGAYQAENPTIAWLNAEALARAFGLAPAARR